MRSPSTSDEKKRCLLVGLSTLLRLGGQDRIPPQFNIALGQPFARLDELDNVQNILDKHDGSTDARQDPRPGRIHLVGSGHLQRRGTVGVGEQLADDGAVHLRAALDGGGFRLAHRLEELG